MKEAVIFPKVWSMTGIIRENFMPDNLRKSSWSYLKKSLLGIKYPASKAIGGSKYKKNQSGFRYTWS